MSDHGDIAVFKKEASAWLTQVELFFLRAASRAGCEQERDDFFIKADFVCDLLHVFESAKDTHDLFRKILPERFPDAGILTLHCSFDKSGKSIKDDNRKDGGAPGHTGEVKQ